MKAAGYNSTSFDQEPSIAMHLRSKEATGFFGDTIVEGCSPSQHLLARCSFVAAALY